LPFGRYHVAGGKGFFYAREPYMNVDAAHVTRFIGLAAVGNASKQVCFSQQRKDVYCLVSVNHHFHATFIS